MTEENQAQVHVDDVSQEQVDAYMKSRGEQVPDVAQEKPEQAAQSQPEGQEKRQEQGKKFDEELLQEHENLKRALKAEREQRKQMKQRLYEYEQKQKSEQNQSAEQQRQNDEAKLEELKKQNPTEYTERKIKMLEEKINQYDYRFQEQENYAKAVQTQQQLIQRAQSDVEDFAAKTPDYNDAYEHLYKSMLNEMVIAGNSKEDAVNALLNNEFNLAYKTLSQGKSFAETLYKLAQARGYKPGVGGNGAGKQRQQASQVDVMNELNKSQYDNFDSIARGQQYDSLGKGGGDTPRSNTTLEQLADMKNGDDFLKEFDKLMR